MKKIWKKGFLSLCMAALVTLQLAAPVQAKSSYKYEVTVYAGNQGAFADASAVRVEDSGAVITQNGDKIVVSNITPGTHISIDAAAQGKVSVTNEKYYVKGVRISGRDNSEYNNPGFAVDSDVEYVVAYGIAGNLVSYTVRYEDESGKELAPEATYYGNVGDKPILAYTFVDGYEPQTYNLTKTLSENAAENVFTFVYRPVQTEVIIDNSNNNGNNNNNNNNANNNGSNANGGSNANNNANANGGNNANGANNANGTNTTTPGTNQTPGQNNANGNDATANNNANANGNDNNANGNDVNTNPDDNTNIDESDTPQDRIDLDDPDTPQGNLDIGDVDGNNTSSDASRFPFIVGIVGGVVGVVAILMLALLLIRKGVKMANGDQKKR